MKTLKNEYGLYSHSKVCNLAFSKTSNQLITAHADNQNELRVWTCNKDWLDWHSVHNTSIMLGHKTPPLYLAMNHSGDTVATMASDRTFRFWHPFENDLQA